MGTYFLAGGAVCAVVAAISDLRGGRIPNRLTYSAALLGLAARATFGGWRGAADAVLAALICGGIFLLFFLMGGMGAGDVKLMAAIACWAGVREGLVVLLATAVAGGVLAVGYMIFYRRGIRTMQNLGSLLRFHFLAGLRSHPEINLQNPDSVKIPYALAIAAGTVYCMGLLLLGG